MDHMDQHAAKQLGHHGHSCGCQGRGGGEQAAGAQAPAHGQGQVAARALDILDERFARGEIEKAEYQEKKQLISQRAAPAKVDDAGPPPPPAARNKSRSAQR